MGFDFGSKTREQKGPALRGLWYFVKWGRRQPTFGSLNASISPSKALIGTQLQNTFLSP